METANDGNSTLEYILSPVLSSCPPRLTRFKAYQAHDSFAADSGYEDHGQDRSQRGGPGGGFAKKRLVPSEPSPHVIFLGLDPDFTESDVRRFSSLS
jgi:hypothetical protein